MIKLVALFKAPEAVVSLDEGPHPLPVIGALLEEGFLFVQVCPGTEGLLSGASQDHHAHRVIVRCVLEGAAQLFEGAEVRGVKYLGTVDSDCGNTVALRIQDVGESQLIRGESRGVIHLCHLTIDERN